MERSRRRIRSRVYRSVPDQREGRSPHQSRCETRRDVGSFEGRHPDVRNGCKQRHLQRRGYHFERFLHDQLPRPDRQSAERQVRYGRRSDDHRSLDHRYAEDRRRSVDERLARRPCRFGQHHPVVDRRCQSRRQGNSVAERQTDRYVAACPHAGRVGCRSDLYAGQRP